MGEWGAQVFLSQGAKYNMKGNLNEGACSLFSSQIVVTSVGPCTDHLHGFWEPVFINSPSCCSKIMSFFPVEHKRSYYRSLHQSGSFPFSINTWWSLAVKLSCNFAGFKKKKIIYRVGIWTLFRLCINWNLWHLHFEIRQTPPTFPELQNKSLYSLGINLFKT